MSRTLIRVSIPLISGALVALGMFACSSSDNGTGTGDQTGTGGSGVGGASGGAPGGGTSNGGGGTSPGGTSNGGGGTAAGGGGASNGGASADVYVCLAKPPAVPVGTIAAGAECCPTSDATVGKAGTCVAESSITDPLLKKSYGIDGCAAGLKCAPKDSLQSQAASLGVYEKCTTNLGANLNLEGRCLPKCFVAGNPQAVTLLQETCKAADLVCAPCFSPVDGTATGACTVKTGDAPTTTAPTPFKTCGAFDGGPAGGTCVPQPLIDAAKNPAAGKLLQDDCPTGDKCVPTLLAGAPTGCFPKCTTTLGATFGDPKYTPGACVPTYIVRDVNAAGLTLLAKDVCNEGELCAPCLDPLNSGAPTNSCG